MALNKLSGTIYVCHCFLFLVPQSILYYIPFHIIYITLTTKIVFCSKCPSNTFSNIFSNIFFYPRHFYFGKIVLLEMHLYIMVVNI
jgi:hypothetical protein